MELPKRKRTRLKGYDYRTPGTYFITICVKNRRKLLGNIVVGQGLAPAENYLSILGNIAKIQIEELEKRYVSIKIERYVIMPNHIHLLLSICGMAAGASPCPTISDIVCGFKSCMARTRRMNGFSDTQLFQSSFHDYIVRNEKDFQRICEYIDNNVIRWEQDCFFDEKQVRKR